MKRRITDIADSITPQALVDLANGLRLGVVIADHDGMVSEVNPSAAGVFRPGRTVFQSAVSPADFQDSWTQLPVGGVVPVRIAVERGDRRHWLDAVVLRSSPASTILVYRDITIKLDAQEELLRERGFYRSLLGQLGVGLALLDTDLNILWVNEIAAAMFSGPMAEGHDKCYEIMSGSAGPCNGCPVTAALQSGEVSSAEVRLRDASGRDRVFRTVAAPVKDFRGRIEQVSLVIEDVTLERNREDEYRTRLEKDVRDKTRDLEESNRRLRMLDRVKEEFLANITHELRTPLVSGIGYIELMLQGGAGDITPAAREGLEISHRNLLRLVGLIEDLLTYTRLSSGREEILREPLDLSRLVRDCVSDVTVRPEFAPGLLLDLDISESLPRVWADADKIYRVVSNLVANAVKFAGSPPHVRVSASSSDDAVLVSVEDNGPGIPPEERSRVFERFHRGSAAVKGGRRGAGIGLSLVAQILQAHNSSLDIRDSLLGGAAMSFALPVVSDPAAGPPPGPSGLTTVLIIDDDSEVAGLLGVALRDVGCSVCFARPGDWRPALLAETSPSLVLLDMGLDPAVSLGLLEQVRRSSDLPVIVMSSGADAASESAASSFGAAALLRKPFAISALTSLVADIAGK
ncbi:MAG: PAS domain-containing protein [Planctomycetes bacterium]|nr:PAS domain-containing protein [Planctomycetota bacterium]